MYLNAIASSFAVVVAHTITNPAQLGITKIGPTFYVILCIVLGIVFLFHAARVFNKKRKIPPPQKIPSERLLRFHTRKTAADSTSATVFIQQISITEIFFIKIAAAPESGMRMRQRNARKERENRGGGQVTPRTRRNPRGRTRSSSGDYIYRCAPRARGRRF